MTLNALFLLVFAFVIAGCDSSPETLVKQPQGPVMLKGEILVPLEKTYLYVYKKGMDLYGPALYLSEPTGADGSFELPLPPGDYIVVARKRVNGETSGPVLTGDHRSEFVEVQIGDQSREIRLLAPLKIGDSQVVGAPAQIAGTGLSGRVTDADGKPVEGLRVHIYDHVQMSERPKFVTERTDSEGRYQFFLPEGGTYYLCARDKFGGPPSVGDLYGRYDQGTIEPSAVVIPEGAMMPDVDLTVTRVW